MSPFIRWLIMLPIFIFAATAFDAFALWFIRVT